MKTYYGNGLEGDLPYFIDDDCEFMIQELETTSTERYVYPRDSIKYTLDGECVRLYDTFMNMVFDDRDMYYQESYCLPIWVQDAGQNSDCAISAELFSQWIMKKDVPNLYKHLYLADCQFLVGTIQNLLGALEDAFISYYTIISSCKDSDAFGQDLIGKNGTVMTLSQTSRQAAAAVETYFTKAYSILDIMCKICYELQFIQTEFDVYKKIKSADVLWGARKKLNIDNTKDTIFEKCELISRVESIRNEIVHNGTWELNPKIFIRFENGQAVERFMLFPDFSQGHLATVKNRKHFFSKGTKINDELPLIHFELKKRLLKTIELVNYYDKPSHHPTI